MPDSVEEHKTADKPDRPVGPGASREADAPRSEPLAKQAEPVDSPADETAETHETPTPETPEAAQEAPEETQVYGMEKAWSARDSVPEPFRPTEVQRDPVLLNLAEVARKIRFPDSLRQASLRMGKRLDGRVEFRLLIDEQGVPVDYVLIKSVVLKGRKPLADPPAYAVRDMEAKAAQYIMELRYKPALQNDRPVKFWETVPITFKYSDFKMHYKLWKNEQKQLKKQR